MYEQVVKFIQEIYKTNQFIPLHEPKFIAKEKQYLNKAIDSTFVSSVGEFVDKFETNLAEYTGSEKAIALVNGTSALHLSLVLAGVNAGDYVLTQSLTFVATCNAISYCKAEPIFIDVDKKTLGLSPIALEDWLEINAYIDELGQCKYKENNRVIKACVPMHTFGHPLEIDKVLAVCDRWNIFLIEDAAESLGSLYKDTHTGTFGKLGALSFNGNKIVTTGGGGALLCNENFYNQGKHLSTTAKIKDDISFFHDQVGFNYRLPNLNAALGCAQLESIQFFLEQKRQLAKEYEQFFKDSNIKFFTEPKDCYSNYWLNTLILDSDKEKNEFLLYTNDKKVMTRPVWTPMHKLPMFSDSICGQLTNTAWLEERIVNIPSSVRND